MNTVLLIIPCFNEEKRLNINAFKDYHKVDFLFANDGSKDKTLDILQLISQNDHCNFFHSNNNLGKAEIIRRAFLELKDLSKYSWIGFYDADLATPLSQIDIFLEYIKLEKSYDSFWASRILRLGANIKRSSRRHYFSRIFATISSLLLDIEAYDTQCGFKIFKTKTFQQAFNEPFISKWIFDIEILLRIDKSKILEIPLSHWEDISGSKLNIYKECPRVLKDLVKIKYKYHFSR
jgi:dolichyl-phosphate beta-glucosyltransferase